jgi:hypothetical protein
VIEAMVVRVFVSVSMVPKLRLRLASGFSIPDGCRARVTLVTDAATGPA